MKFGMTALHHTLMAGVALSVLTAPAHAKDPKRKVDEIVVYGEVIHRDRMTITNPVLSYDLEYFQRFEPVSVGDALRRTPGVSFTSDVGEYDGAQLRGLNTAYTQILIDGRQIPGAENDRSFFVDRIPAELIERIEIIRSPSADMSSDGIGGTVNVILREGATLEGGYVRLSGIAHDSGDFRGSAAIAHAGSLGEANYMAHLDVQQRFNPKKKITKIFDDTGAFDEELETEQDTRDGIDYSASFEIDMPIHEGELVWSNFAVFTDREERETVEKFEGPLGAMTLEELEAQKEFIEQLNFTTQAEFTHPVGNGEMELVFGYTKFIDDIRNLAFEADAGDPLALDEVETIDTDDDTFFGTAAAEQDIADGLTIKMGLDVVHKRRDTDQDIDGDLFRIDLEETRIDPFAKVEFQLFRGMFVEAGARYETTQRDISGIGFGGDVGSGEVNTKRLNPSVHLRYELTDTDQIRFSAARTVRRPNFDLLTPIITEEEPGDDDILVGNPRLNQETAWGFDLGVERALGQTGVIGLNGFFRNISGLIEPVSTGVSTGSGSGTIFRPRNIGSGQIWGVEFDVSSPLTLFNMPDTGVFGSFTWIDSQTDDPFTGDERRFRDQPNYILNVGFIHSIEQTGTAFGVSYQKRGASFAIDPDEIEKTTYDGNLDVFIEQRLGKGMVIRLSGTNLLDANKDEFKTKFDGDSAAELKAAIAANDVDEFETQNEESSRVITLTFRAAF